MKDNDLLLGLIGSQQDREESAPAEPAGSIVDNVAGAEANAAPQPSAEAVHEVLADNLRDMTGASFLYCTVASSLSGDIDPQAFKIYRDKLLQDAGNPSDPLETMLLEQLALAHFNIGRLQMKSCSVENSKLAVAYSDAATRLLGEFRRCTLALEEFRAKQIARKDHNASITAAAKKSPTKRNGKPQPSNGKKPSKNGRKPVNGKKKAITNELGGNRHGETPEWLKKRMAYPTPSGSALAASTDGNGKASHLKASSDFAMQR
jgi:hypothetical protein